MDHSAIGVSAIATRCSWMLEVDISIATNKVGWYKLDMLFQPNLVWRLEVGHSIATQCGLLLDVISSIAS